ncbi:hypothetical protein B0293_26815 [Amycolatopsis azurea DSM 43854]|uniref:Uncharacterized protein n=1 Tax=Amycolatopsis azurea DSM 43854 TaxID=1238180 RepID=A0ABX3J847_9PSEU|nr:hypothetical protein B0293_26815 [Amycolatopsis azurea DSM 43854]
MIVNGSATRECTRPRTAPDGTRKPVVPTEAGPCSSAPVRSGSQSGQRVKSASDGQSADGGQGRISREVLVQVIPGRYTELPVS